MPAHLRHRGPDAISTPVSDNHAAPPHDRRAGTRLLLALTALALLALPGMGACAAHAPETRAVLASTDEVTKRLAASYSRDLAWLRLTIESSLRTQRTILLGRLHRSLINDGLLTLTGTDPARLDELLAAASDTPNAPGVNPLIAEVRAATLTRSEAARFLNDYGAAGALSDEVRQSVRNAMLARLTPVREHDRASTALLSAFDAHAAEVIALFDQVHANTETLRRATALRERLDAQPVRRRELWLPILERIDDPLLRAAAEDLLTAALPAE